jgi:hypothetical protein
MNYENSIIVSEYEDGHLCVEVGYPDGTTLVLTSTLDEVEAIDQPWDEGASKSLTLLDLPLLESQQPGLYTPLEGIVYRRTGKLVEVDDFGRCRMEVIEVLVEPGEYRLLDGDLVNMDDEDDSFPL